MTFENYVLTNYPDVRDKSKKRDFSDIKFKQVGNEAALIQARYNALLVELAEIENELLQVARHLETVKSKAIENVGGDK